MRWWVMVSLLAFSLPLIASGLTAQEPESAKYSPEVVAKADKILEGVGLHRSGKSIQSLGVPEISRAISGLSREKRQLRMVYQDWKNAQDRLAAVRTDLERLNQRYGELSLQLARVAGVDVAANNRVVGLLNATNAQTKTLATQREQLKEEVKSKRKVLDDAESEYAETILALRADFHAERAALAKYLMDENVRIALRVMHANFATPESLTADKILAALDKRIQRVEQEIFSEMMDLDVERGALWVNVVVGRETVRMAVDSGATMVTLPIKAATQLGITVPLGARELKLVLADGRSIPARAVTLPRVRVGEFEAENVEAVVLDAAAADAQPLLGMSFLENFKFEIDTAGKTLTLLRVAAE